MRLIDADELNEYLYNEYENDACRDDDDDWSAGRASAFWAIKEYVENACTIKVISGTNK